MVVRYIVRVSLFSDLVVKSEGKCYFFVLYRRDQIVDCVLTIVVLYRAG